MSELFKTVARNVARTAALGAVYTLQGHHSFNNGSFGNEGVVAIETLPQTCSIPADSSESWKIGGGEAQVRVDVAPAEWTNGEERKFRQLTAMIATLKASEADQTEFHKLTKKRRAYKNPRTSEEILWEYKQQQVTHQLMEAIQAYAQFHDSPKSPCQTNSKAQERS